MKISQCKNCFKTFKITDQDLEFYQRIKISNPSFCPDCRAQRRLAFRNERSLYTTKCSLCQKSIISNYSPDKPNPVYCYDCYYSDKWDSRSYGQDFNFQKSFFEQFQELKKKVPKLNLIKSNCENCDYMNLVGDSKNCYLIFGSIFCEDCYYGSPYYSKNCIDSLLIQKCELCYECITSENLFYCQYCQDCYDSHGLLFCYDCRGCQDCLGCAGLRNKKFYIFNQEYSEIEYKLRKKELNLCDPEKKDYVIKYFAITKTKHPRRFMIGTQYENVAGNYINTSKNAAYSFDVNRGENIKYCVQVLDLKDSYDISNVENAELCYEISAGYKLHNSRFGNFIWLGHDLDYCECCNNNHDLFGCISMLNSSYCILNKQYSENEYKVLREKIILHMQKTGEWGEFFPIFNSNFGYNETVAQEYYPIKKENAREKKWLWREKEIKDYQPQKYRVLLDIQKVPDNICQATLACKNCKKNYKIIPQELAFYKKDNLPIPKLCPDCRHQARMALRTPRALWHRQCMCTQPDHLHHGRCDHEFETTYSPDHKELVYCEDCYNREIY